MNQTYYFSHDSNAIQDPKMMTLLFECGLTGIGLFWIIIEILHQQECSGIATAELQHYINFYGKQGNWQEDLLIKCRGVLFKTKLLIERDGMVFSGRVIKNLKNRKKLIENARLKALKRWEFHATALPQHSHGNAIKESKGKESKVKVTTIVTLPQTDQPLTDIQKIVIGFKMIQGYPKDDKAWDKLNFSRCSRSAKALLDFLGGWKLAVDCSQDIYERLTGKGLTVTLETIIKHAAEWKKDQMEKGGFKNGILPVSSNGGSALELGSIVPDASTRTDSEEDY